MRCDLINNLAAIPTDILDSFTFQNTSFGSNGVYAPNFESNINLKPGTYDSLSITLVDQNFNRIAMNDSNVLITLLIKLPVKK